MVHRYHGMIEGAWLCLLASELAGCMQVQSCRGYVLILSLELKRSI